MSRKLLRRIIIGGLVVGLSAAGFYILKSLAIAVMWASILYGRDIMDASAINSRGDKVIAETNFFTSPEDRSRTVITLRRTDHWFSTTLLESRSWEVLVGLRWQDDDTLDLQLEFGCDAQTSPNFDQILD